MIPAHALLLTAGLGTRLRPLTYLRAKAALPVAGCSLAERIVRSLARQGIGDIVMNLHHLPETLAGSIGDGSQLGVRVRYSWEQPVVLGSAGGPRHALDTIAADTFFVLNGDTLTDVALSEVAVRHRTSGASVTLALVPNTAPLRYGGVTVDPAGFVTGFVRRGPDAKGSYHFIGVQVADRAVFAELRDDEPASSIGGVYDELLRTGRKRIAAHISDARFMDIGTASDYLDTSLALSAEERRCRVCAGTQVTIAASARVVDSVLWDDITIGADCALSRCIVTDRVDVPPGSRHDRAILMKADSGMIVAPLGD